MLPLNGELQPYLVDFGDAQCFQDSELETRKHETRHIVGTLPFVSINVHKGMRELINSRMLLTFRSFS